MAPTRDPETGQFVSGTGEQLNYDDLDIQVVGGNLSIGGEADSVLARRQVEPVGGSLGRGEVAELVAIQNGGVFLFAGSGPDPNEAHGRYQLGTSPKLETYQGQFGVGEGAAAEWEIIDTENGLVTEADLGGNQVSKLQNEVWYHSSPHQYGFVHEEANNQAGGATMHMDHHDVHFRDVAASGPVLDRHHEVYEVANVESSASGQVTTLYRNLTLLWNVVERGDLA